MALRRLCAAWALLFGLSGCASFLQAKKDAATAVTAAKNTLDQARRMNAPMLAPQDYREARETLLEAQDQFKSRRYGDAKEMADLARYLAESAVAHAVTAAKVAPKKTKKAPPKKKAPPRKSR